MPVTADPDAPFPSVPHDRLRSGGWELVDESVEPVFRLPGLTVTGATLLYRDTATGEAVRELTGVDAIWRFFVATALAFDPPIPSHASRTVLLPTVRARATDAFRGDLRDRGLIDVRRASQKQVRLDSGKRVRLTGFRARLDLAELDVTIPIVGWIGVWYDDGFRIGAGAYPDESVAGVLCLERPLPELAREPADYQRELFDLITAID